MDKKIQEVNISIPRETLYGQLHVNEHIMLVFFCLTLLNAKKFSFKNNF